MFEYDINQGVGLQTDRTNLNQSIDSLRVLADNTDGRAIVNRNDLAAGMKQIMRDASGYYLLGYTSTAAPTDGKFHTIDVRVKRPGVEVRSRKGYWAYTAEDAARAATPPKAGPPPEISQRAQRHRRAGERRPRGAVLDRHSASGRRPGARHVRLGAPVGRPGSAGDRRRGRA